MASLFGSKKSARWPNPTHLYALSPERGDHWNFRQFETLQPLSDNIGVEIGILAEYDVQEPFFSLLQSGKTCGQVVLVSWNQYIPELSLMLGCGPDQGCPSSFPDDEFDLVWQLKYVFHPSKGNHVGETNLTSATDGDNRRRLKHHGYAKHGWNVYATLTREYFDPLAFSKSVGDYPDGGTPSGGRWNDEM